MLWNWRALLRVQYAGWMFVAIIASDRRSATAEDADLARRICVEAPERQG
jgi:hypothetical protein